MQTSRALIFVSFGSAAGLASALALPSCARRAETPQAEPASLSKPVAGARAQLPVAIDNSGALAQVAERALPAVVSVASTRAAKFEAQENPLDNPLFRHFFGPQGPSPFPGPNGPAPQERGIGSGVIVGKDLILTNAHVVEDAKEIEVTAGDRRVLQAKVIGSDPKSDLAVLRITSDTQGLTSLEFADSSQARLGQVVLAIGNPFGVGQTVTMGIISAKGRADLGIEAYEDFIQTDAAINPGNSGGALVDLEGKLVGVPTAILSRSGGYMGVGFAIPSNMAKPIMTSLVEHGRVIRGYLGVGIQNLDTELAKALSLPSADGVLISDVSANSPAEKAGIKRGDVILELNGQRVQTTGQLRNLVATSGADATTKLELLRNGKKQTVDVKLAAMPDEPTKPGSAAAVGPGGALGVQLAPLDAATRAERKLPPTVQGVLVVQVQPGSPAAAAGIRPGDIIEQIDKQAVTKPEQLAQQWATARGTSALVIWRDGHTFFAAVKHP